MWFLGLQKSFTEVKKRKHLFLIFLLGKLDIQIEMCLDFYLILYSEVHLSWIINLNVEAEIIKLQVENLGKYLHHFAIGKNFLNGHKID